MPTRHIIWLANWVQHIFQFLYDFSQKPWYTLEFYQILQELEKILAKTSQEGFLLFAPRSNLQEPELLLSSHIPSNKWKNIHMKDWPSPLQTAYCQERIQIVRFSRLIEWPLHKLSMEKNWIIAPIPLLRNTPIFQGKRTGGILAIATDSPLRVAKFFVATLANQISIAIVQNWLYKSAILDPLCQVYTRGHFFEMLSGEILPKQTYPSDFSLVLIDIDHFKKVNDTYTHAAGDKILQQFCNVLQKLLQKKEILARYGGEEFLLFVPLQHNMAMERAENIRRSIEKTPLYLPNKQPVFMTLSAGVGTLREKETLEECLLRTDAGLYLAKASGRNCIKTIP